MSWRPPARPNGFDARFHHVADIGAAAGDDRSELGWLRDALRWATDIEVGDSSAAWEKAITHISEVGESYLAQLGT